MNHHELAQQIVDRVGGPTNVIKVIHCITRLRFFLKDETIAKTEEINELKGVMSVVKSGGQYQVVIGSQVGAVYSEVIDILGTKFSGEEAPSAEEVQEAPKKKNVFNRFLETLTGTITPVIGPLAAAGILKGILALLTIFKLITAESGAYLLLNALADALFYFFPILLGFSAGKKLKTNPYIPAIIGAALVHPTVVAQLANVDLDFFGIPVVLMNYSSSVFPVLVAAWLCSYVEKWLNKKLPSATQLILTPLFTMVVVGVLTFLLIGPVITFLSGQLATVVFWIYNLSPMITGFILGGFWQILVIFGLHWGMLPISIGNFMANGHDPLLAILAVSIFCQLGAALGMLIKTKDPIQKEIAAGATISAMFGVTEPTLYGICLKFKRVLWFSILGGGIGGAIMGAMNAEAYGVAGGVFSLFGGINPAGIDHSFYAMLISFVVAVFGTAALVFIFGYEKRKKKGEM